MGVLCLCVSCVKNVEMRDELKFSQLREVIYQYQRICDKYIPEDRFGDAVAEGEEWDIITGYVGDPYSAKTRTNFWADYGRR